MCSTMIFTTKVVLMGRSWRTSLATHVTHCGCCAAVVLPCTEYSVWKCHPAVVRSTPCSAKPWSMSMHHAQWRGLTGISWREKSCMSPCRTPSSYSSSKYGVGGCRRIGKDTPVTGPGSWCSGGRAEDAAVIYFLVIYLLRAISDWIRQSVAECWASFYVLFLIYIILQLDSFDSIDQNRDDPLQC